MVTNFTKLLQQKVHSITMLDDASVSRSDLFKTPKLKAMSDRFVVKRPNSSIMTLDSSPVLENFDNTAAEELWMQLNQGCVTNLDMLQMTPEMKNQSSSSLEMSHVSD